MTISTPHRARTAAAVLALTLGLAGCGSDDGATVTELNEGEGSVSGSASGSGSASASASGSASGSGSATGEAECTPVNPDLEDGADTTVQVDALDYAYDPDEIAVEAGTITFEVANEGAENHELAFLPGGDDVPFTEDGEPDEAALEEAGAFELEAFGPGQTCNATYELDPGEYTLFCIITTPEGETHYELGMRGTLTVS